MANRKRGSKNRNANQLRFETLERRQVLANFVGTVDATSPDTSLDFEKEICFHPLMLNSSAPEVVGRHVFYNDSSFDGNDAAANADDDNAIATDKVALLPGETATIANYTSYLHGINGIIVDADLTDPAGFSGNDLKLATGSGDNLSDYERIDETPEVSVRAGEGINGSDRITIVLPNGTVTNEYLQVTLFANATTGFGSNDVFYFGNAIAETGDTTDHARVNAVDISRVRNSLSGFFAQGVDNLYDFNRDTRVNAVDISIVRNSLSGFFPIPLVNAPVEGVDYFVTSAAEIDAITSSLQPGDTVTMQDGFWTNQEIDFSGIGTEERPITLRAQTPGEVILNGSSSLNICGDWLVAEGLNFNGGALGEGDHVVEFRDGSCEATNSRLTNSAITNYNPSNVNTRYFWVSLYGQNNRVDHNSFSGQNHSGVTVTVWRDSSDADFHLIDNNYFADRPEGTENGYETIRIGTSAESLSDSFTVVESNLFERTDGEIEIISNKSGSNIFRNNTFREAAGTLTLRHGDNNIVEGNFFLGEGKDATGGVRVIGENQTVVNNYFEGLDGRADGAISISAGVPNSPNNGYFQVQDAVIAHNTIVNVNGAGVIFDHGFGSSGRTELAENVTFANNLISSTLDPLFEGVEGNGWTWEGNIAFGQSLGPKDGDAGITVVDPQLVLGTDGIWRLDTGSPAIDGSTGDYSSVTGGIDFDGQARIGIYDVGADELSADPVTRSPLVIDDVGNYWMGLTNGSSADCSCVAVDSDDYFAALDPNGDGDSWTVADSSDAFGGSTLVAPSGGIVNLPGTHDGIVTYNLEFDEAGTYTAYYRARGFDGGSDSMYTPDGFGVDPDNTQTLSNDGVYGWETGATYVVTSSDIGSSLEFRVGKREKDAELDAFVLHLDDSLTQQNSTPCSVRRRRLVKQLRT